MTTKTRTANERYGFIELAIQRARSGGRLSQDVKLLLLGRIQYALERDDISVAESEALFELVEPGMRDEYDDAIATAVFGGTDRELASEDAT